jgi:hypothetical protein
MTCQKAPLPASRDLFVNNFLRYAGEDPATGEARYWICSWNHNAGCLAVLVTESGKSKVFRFDPVLDGCGFYSAAYAGDDKMWLCGYIDKLLCLDLKTGEIERFSTGLEKSLAFSGFIYDEATRTILGGTYSQESFSFVAFCFDTESRQCLKTFSISTAGKGNYFYHYFDNGDGTYTMSLSIPNFAFWRWDPAALEISELKGCIRPHGESKELQITAIMEDSKIYVATKGWFDPATGQWDQGGRPERDAAWFGRRENKVYGARETLFGNSELYAWDTGSQRVERIAEIPDCSFRHFAVTKGGMILAVNYYGFFYRIDPESKTILASRRLDTDSIASMDCLEKIDEDRVLLAPFISQRFCEVNLRTGAAEDMGRAAAGDGEILIAAALEGRIYMAAYTTGQLVEYDPAQRPRFPENPRIVVHPPSNAMRPVAHCKDRQSLYYACSNRYGTLGSILVKHTPSLGESLFSQNPIGDFIVRTLFYEEEGNQILAGSDIHADCRSCPPAERAAILAALDPLTLECAKKIALPVQGPLARVVGKADAGTYLFAVFHDGAETDYGFWDIRSGRVRMRDEQSAWVARVVSDAQTPDMQPPTVLLAAEKPGMFLTAGGSGIALWDFRRGAKIKDICHESGFQNIFASGGDLFILHRKEMSVYRNYMA